MARVFVVAREAFSEVSHININIERRDGKN
jgi:hypothetical protein